MLNPIDLIKFVISLKKEMPDAFGYSVDFIGSFPLPTDFILSASDLESLTDLKVCIVSIYNFSQKTKKDVRFLYSGNFASDPKISFKRRSEVPVAFIVNKQSKEIVFSEIPPNETVYMFFYNTNNEFKVEDVIVDGIIVTDFMNKIAIRKRYPDMAGYLTYVLSFSVLIMLFFAIYLVYEREKDKEFIDAIYFESFDKNNLCSVSVFHNDSGKDKELYSKFKSLGSGHQNQTLLLNHVSTFDELNKLERIGICNKVSD